MKCINKQCANRIGEGEGYFCRGASTSELAEPEVRFWICSPCYARLCDMPKRLKEELYFDVLQDGRITLSAKGNYDSLVMVREAGTPVTREGYTLLFRSLRAARQYRKGEYVAVVPETLPDTTGYRCYL